MWTTATKSLAIWSDRVEYEGPAFLGLSRRQVTIPPEDIVCVQFDPTKLKLATAEGELTFSFERPAHAQVAREAFRRLGWSFDED